MLHYRRRRFKWEKWRVDLIWWEENGRTFPVFLKDVLKKWSRGEELRLGEPPALYNVRSEIAIASVKFNKKKKNGCKIKTWILKWKEKNLQKQILGLWNSHIVHSKGCVGFSENGGDNTLLPPCLFPTLPWNLSWVVDNLHVHGAHFFFLLIFLSIPA